MGISQPCRPRGFVASTPTPCAAAAAAALLVTGRGAAGEAKDTATAGGVLRTREVGDDSGNKYYGIIPSYIYIWYMEISYNYSQVIYEWNYMELHGA